MASPFFIVGAPRTGSTLLRRLLNNHSRLAIPPESGFLAEYLLANHVDLSIRKKVFCREPEFDYWKIRPQLKELEGLQMIDCIRLIHEKYARANGKEFWGQKTPKLVRTGQIWLEEMPDCKLIHMIRDPRAVALSLRNSRYHNLHLIHGAKRYAADTKLGVELEKNFEKRVLRISYEELVINPETTLHKICDFVELPYQLNILQGEEVVTLTPNEKKFGHHTNVTGRLDPSFTSKWKEQLTEREIAIIDFLVAEVIQELPYEVGAPAAPNKSELKAARNHQFKHAIRHGFKELTQRPDFWRIARRRWRLGNVRKMLRDHSKGM